MSAETRACVEREYPAPARRAVATGTTILEIEADPTGKVTGASVVQSAGSTPEHKLLDELAQSVVRCPGYIPATGNSLKVNQTFVWRLQ
jgi:TonB family protein